MTMHWPEKLWHFQEEDVPFFLKTLKSLVLYQPRLGKTVVTCEVLAKDPETGPGIIIACSKNAFNTWLSHIPAVFARYSPNRTVEVRLIRGTADKRKAEWVRKRKTDIVVYLVTFNSLINDYPFLTEKKARFDTVIGDEVHRMLKNRKNKSAVIFRDFVGRCRRFMALSGTLAGKWGPGDYWTLLNMCDRKRFSTFWGFVNRYCILEDNGFGKVVTGVKNREEFQALLFEFARVRIRSVVRPEMPKTARSLRWVDLTKDQRRVYDTLEAEKVVFQDNGNIIVVANSLEEQMRKRQLLACPAMLDPDMGVGGAFEDLVEMLEEARDDGDIEAQHIVVYTAFRRGLDVWEAYLRERGFNNVWQLYGGLEPEELVKRTSAFKESMGIILCTTKFAQAFSLASSKVCYHIGYEYDPNDNTQAEDRLVGTEGDHVISSIYYSYRDTTDEFIAEDHTLKHRLIHLTTTAPN